MGKTKYQFNSIAINESISDHHNSLQLVCDSIMIWFRILQFNIRNERFCYVVVYQNIKLTFSILHVVNWPSSLRLSILLHWVQCSEWLQAVTLWCQSYYPSTNILINVSSLFHNSQDVTILIAFDIQYITHISTSQIGWSFQVWLNSWIWNFVKQC